MTPFELMNRFNKKYGNRKEVYQTMQQNYIAGNVKKGLFCDGESIKKFELGDLESSLGKVALDNAMRGFEAIEADTQKSAADKAKEGLEFIKNLSAKTSREISIGSRLFGTWRNSLGVYKIDDDMQDQALGSLIPSETPSSIFTQLPEWCVYMELPKDYDLLVDAGVTLEGGGQKEIDGIRVLGFWALHDKADYSKSDIDVAHDENMALNIMLNLDIPEEHVDNNLITPPLILPLSKGLTVNESIKKQYETLIQSDRTKMELDRIFKVTLSMLLWLCVEEPDVSNIKGVQLSREELLKPKYSRHKKTGAFVPPNSVTFYEIGKRLGGEIRDHIERSDGIETVSSKRKRPHMRKGHWHGVWSGTADDRHFSTYWQSAIFVNSK